MKKFLSLLLAMLMVASLFAGCGNAKPNETKAPTNPAANNPTGGGDAAQGTEEPEIDTSEHVVLTMYCIGDEGGIYAQEHLDKLNKVLTEKINAEIEPIMVSWGDYKTKLPMVWASGETYDLTYTANWVSYFDEAGKGAFMDISELFPKYAPETYAELSEADLLETTKVDGKLYMVPNNLPDYTTFIFNYREDLRKKYDCPEIDSWEDLEAYMKAIKENEPGMLPYAIPGNDAVKTQTWLNERDWARPIDNGSVGVFTYDLTNPTEIFNLVDTAEYEEYVTKAREYYLAGYWSQSVLAETTAVKDAFLTGKSAIYAANFANSNGVYVELTNSQPDWEIGYWSSDYDSGVTESIAAANNGMAVGTYSENPERALMFIELCHQDEEVYHILMDGLEGVTFDADYEKMVKWVPETTDPTTTNLKNLGMGFGTQKFYLGSQNDSPVINEMKEAYAERKVFPALSGFVLNKEPISAELAAIKAVCDEYKVPLEKGVVDPVEGLATLKEKLAEAGAEKVLTEINAQLAEYLAK